MIKNYSKDLDYSYTEGFFPTFEMLSNKGIKLERIYVSTDALSSDGYKKLKSIVSEDKITVSDKAFNVIKSKENAHVIGVFKKYESVLDDLKDHLVLVNPSDMGNLGNSFRAALAFDIHDVAIIKPCADMFNPKVIRSSMGAFFKIRVQLFDSFDEYITRYKREYYPFVLARSKGLNEVEFKSPCSLVFGNEATGLPKEIYNENDVKIEQSDEVDSLNLTTSIAIALYKLKMSR